MYYIEHFVIDWEKVKTLEDVKRILKAMDVGFEMDNKNIDPIMDLLVLKEKKHMQTTLD